MKIGDVSRYRRFADPARQRWYAHYRAVRFALRMTQGPCSPGAPPAALPPPSPAQTRPDPLRACG
jgi:hypothetical protein